MHTPRTLHKICLLIPSGCSKLIRYTQVNRRSDMVKGQKRVAFKKYRHRKWMENMKIQRKLWWYKLHISRLCRKKCTSMKGWHSKISRMQIRLRRTHTHPHRKRNELVRLQQSEQILWICEIKSIHGEKYETLSC